MKSTYFCNRKSLEVTSQSIKNDIKILMNNIGSFNLTSKYYTFLNKKNVNNLKDNKFLVALSTFGKKFVLYITKYNTKKYCIFINKKNDTMTVTQLKFTDDIFLGTLFDGELVKNSNDKWIYLINDIAYYKGNNIITKSFVERQNIINNILLNEQENENENEKLYISQKKYFEYQYIKDLEDRYMKNLNYKCSGLYFKNINNFSDNYLFIFPECRSDSKILNEDGGLENINKTVDKTVDKTFGKIMNSASHSASHSGSFSNLILKSSNPKLEEEDLFKDTEIIDVVEVPVFKQVKTSYKLEKLTCNFLIISTPMPDIYELHCMNSNNNIEKYSYASVPDIDTSSFLKNILENTDEKIYVECNYHKLFKKWIPYKKVDTMDNINTINQIQITLESL